MNATLDLLLTHADTAADDLVDLHRSGWFLPSAPSEPTTAVRAREAAYAAGDLLHACLFGMAIWLAMPIVMAFAG